MCQRKCKDESVFHIDAKIMKRDDGKYVVYMKMTHKASNTIVMIGEKIVDNRDEAVQIMIDLYTYVNEPIPEITIQ